MPLQSMYDFIYRAAEKDCELSEEYLSCHIKTKPKYWPKWFYNYCLNKLFNLNYFKKEK